MTAVKNIVFDLGGVVMNIDFAKTEAAFAALGFTGFQHYYTQFHASPLFEDFETGKISVDDFTKGIRDHAGINLGDADIVRAWNALLLDFSPAVIRLLQKLKTRYRIFLLSNTNRLHYQAFQEILHAATGMFLEDIFERTYYSHDISLRKPGEAIYRKVVEENGLIPAETLFIDDTADNLAGAELAGLQTFHLGKPMVLTDMPIFRAETAEESC